MSGSSLLTPLPSARRLVVLTAVLAPIVLLTILAGFWIHSVVPEWVYWEVGLIFLIVLEIAYGLTVAFALLGALVLAIVLVRGKGTRARRLYAARGLVLCLSIGIALGAAEVASAVWSAVSRRGSAMPDGGLPRASSREDPHNMPEPDTKIDAPTEFPDPRDDRAIDIVVLGESSAEGVPYNDWVSIGHIVAWRLREILPQRPVQLEVIAQSGNTLEGQQRNLSRLRRRPDLMLIYCGHNEFSARFDAARDPAYYFDEQLPTTWSLLVERVESASPLCGLIRRTAEKCRIAIPPPTNGYRALVDAPAFTTTEYITLLLDFRRRLEAIVSYAERVGALPVLILPPASDGGFEPNRSFLPAATPRAERASFARDFLAARRTEDLDPRDAQAAYRALLARQPGFAEAHYRLAQLLEREGSFEEAYGHYVLSRDLDGYPMRCPLAFQDAYREVAARHRCILIDGQSYFHAIGRHGLLNDGLFHDAMHPSLRGQIALAQAVLLALRARRAFGWPKDSSEPTIDPVGCAKHFGLGPAVWRRICLWGIMFYDKASPARYDPATRLAKKVTFAVATERIEAGEAPEALGLPNIGTPEPVPAVTIGEGQIEIGGEQ
jgi:hypothetical protein